MKARVARQRMRTYFSQMVAIALLVMGASVAVQAQSGSATGSRFSLTIDGKEIASFSEFGGIASNVEPTGPSGGKTKPPTLTFKRSLTSSSTYVMAWYDAARKGDPAARKNTILTIFDPAGKPKERLLLVKASPSQLTVSPQMVSETLTLTCDSIQPVAP